MPHYPCYFIMFFIIITLLCTACNPYSGSSKAQISHRQGVKAAPPPTDSRVSATENEKTLSTYDAPSKVVIILLDALRPDYLGFVDGKSPETAPGLARLSRDAMVFTRAFSTSSWTAPSTASIFTSLYPQGHGIQYGFKAQRSFNKKFDSKNPNELSLNRLPKNRRILSEIFKNAGYETFAISTNINISRRLGFNRGFTHFSYIPYEDAPAEEVVNHLKDWQPKINTAKKSLVYLHLNDAHKPYHVRRPWYTGGDPEKDPAGRYRSEISYADAHLQQMLKILDVNDDTLLLVLSDHGEEFLDHGGREHGPTLYQELIRVLLMVRWPNGGIVSGKSDLNVGHIDVLPTLLDFAGIQIPKGVEGTTLVPLLRNSDSGQKALQLSHRAMFAHRIYSKIRDLHITALMLGKWKLINHRNQYDELFFHVKDPGDHNDLSKIRPNMFSQLKSRMEKLTTRLNQKEPLNETAEIRLDEELLERLERLGYTAESDTKKNIN